MPEFLPIALALTEALRSQHDQHVVHRDIRPQNVFVDRQVGRVRLLGFGSASRLPRQQAEFAPPDRIDGALAYLSPEQTGRIDRQPQRSLFARRHLLRHAHRPAPVRRRPRTTLTRSRSSRRRRRSPARCGRRPCYELIRIVLQQAGAQFGALALDEGGTLRLAACQKCGSRRSW